MTEACVHCGLCTKTCTFLQKYELDLALFARHPELAYHCFLCGDCSRVCPKGIDGRALSLAMRRERIGANGGKLPESGYGALTAEKKNYLFRNYRRAMSDTALFPGCNFPSFFPKTTDALVRLLGDAGIGTVYDCCGKPMGDLGLEAEESRIGDGLRRRLSGAGIRRLVVLCPNCYYYLRSRLDIGIISIYELLEEMGVGHVIAGTSAPLFLPCPDRDTGDLLRQLRYFLPDAAPIEGVQCCGLGGCASGKEPEIAASFAQTVGSQHRSTVYTYCASCAGQLRRGGVEGATHVLTEILATHEKPVLSGAQSLWNRARRVF